MYGHAAHILGSCALYLQEPGPTMMTVEIIVIAEHRASPRERVDTRPRRNTTALVAALLHFVPKLMMVLRNARWPIR
jgi:hypothetical protein